MISTDEAERIPGFPPRSTLRRWAREGEILGQQVLKGSRLIWLVDVESVRLRLAGKPNEGPTLDDLVSRWESEQASGFHTGRAIGPRGIQANSYGLMKFWEYLHYTPKADRPDDYKIPVGKLAEVTAGNLKQAISTVPIDRKARNCHFAIRDQMYKGTCSFLQFLIRLGHAQPHELVEARKLKPKRIYPANKTVLTEADLKKLLDKNQGYKAYRQDEDVVLTQTVIMLASMAGLRREEMLDLELQHIRLKDREIDIVDGKGNKARRVGIVARLAAQLKLWMQIRPETDHPGLLVTKTGRPLDERGLARRVEWAAKKAGVTVTPHGLRRTFTTVNTQRGMPLPVAQKLLGHSDIKTTMGYCLIDEQEAVDYLK